MELLIRHCAETVVSTGNKKNRCFGGRAFMRLNKI